MDDKNKEKSMTALVCAFSRAYHSRNNVVKIFDDTVAGKLLYDEEYNSICQNMAQGIDFFNKGFQGSRDEALRWIVDNQLSPSPLGRSAYGERKLEMEVRKGIEQYLILAAGFDTFPYRQPSWAKKLQIFEIDHPYTSEDKLNRLAKREINIPSNTHHIAVDFNDIDWPDILIDNMAFKAKKKSFCSLLGIVYYISMDSFKMLLEGLKKVIPEESVIIIDYPVDNNEYGDKRVIKQEMMARGAKEEMLAKYSREEMSALINGMGYEIIEELTPEDITNQFFYEYNQANTKHRMTAMPSVNYLAARLK